MKAAGRVIRLLGNHEIREGVADFVAPTSPSTARPSGSSTRERPCFLFHGHQAGKINTGRYNGLISWSLRVFANTLRIGNSASPTTTPRSSNSKGRL